MKRCEHAGPHYRANPNGEPGLFLCKDCIAQTEMEPDDELVKLAEEIDANLRGRGEREDRG